MRSFSGGAISDYCSPLPKGLGKYVLKANPTTPLLFTTRDTAKVLPMQKPSQMVVSINRASPIWPLKMLQSSVWGRPELEP